MKTKKKPSDLISVIGLLVILFGFLIAMFLVPDKTFSETENRVLAEMPKLTADRLFSGKYSSELTEYLSDQFPGRNFFVSVKAASELLLGKQENNDVILAKDNYLIAKEDNPNPALLRENLAAVKGFSEKEIPALRVAIAGRSQDVLVKYLPAVYPAEEKTEALFSEIEAALDGVQTVDLLTPLKKAADAGESVYYRTDHHWTTEGAYLAYAEIMRSFGLEPNPIEHYEIETVSREFYGTSWSKAGYNWIAPEEMHYFRWAGDDLMQTTIMDNGKTFAGLYDRSYLSVKDKYSSFIGGNNGRVSVKPSDKSPLASTERETLVLVKDSFAHSVAPFLAEHFDLEIIDLRYFAYSVTDLCERVGADKVLILYNAGSLVDSDNLQRLSYGLPLPKED